MSARAINWFLQRITGAALLVLLIMHFWVEHFAAEVRTPAGLGQLQVRGGSSHDLPLVSITWCDRNKGV